MKVVIAFQEGAACETAETERVMCQTGLWQILVQAVYCIEAPYQWAYNSRFFLTFLIFHFLHVFAVII